MKMMWILFSGLMAFFACGSPGSTSFDYNEDGGPLSAASPITYLALGDSYTIGESVSADKRFPVQLRESLTALDQPVEHLDIVARTGWTTDELKAGIDARDDLRTEYDLVTLLIGVNNQYRGYPVADYRESFPEMLDIAVEFAGGDKDRVVVISIPDYAYTPFGGGNPEISEGIDAYNAINKELTLLRGITYVNITDISRRGLDEPELVASDGLHPSGAQYALWVERIAEAILSQ